MLIMIAIMVEQDILVRVEDEDIMDEGEDDFKGVRDMVDDEDRPLFQDIRVL
jgi:hypothetical protein